VDIRWITPAGVQKVSDPELSAYAARKDGVTWVHLDYRDESGMAALIGMIKPKQADLRAVTTRNPVPKLHLYPDHHFSAISGLARGNDGLLHFQPLKTFLTPQVLWTVFGPATASLSPAAINHDLELVRLELDDQEVCPTTAFELITVIRRVMMRGQEDIIADGARRIAELEGRVMDSDPVSAEAVLQDLFELRHDLQTIRINAAQAYELWDNQLETQSIDRSVMQIDTQRLTLLRRQYGHLKNSADLEREYLQEVLDLFQTRVANELNRFVRKITAFGTIAISWTVVAGIYGMNFINMPELSWTYGYPSAIGVMIVVSLILWYLFHRQHWL
jgi:Mg2+ and Co2+ transporter CorA